MSNARTIRQNTGATLSGRICGFRFEVWTCTGSEGHEAYVVCDAHRRPSCLRCLPFDLHATWSGDDADTLLWIVQRMCAQESGREDVHPAVAQAFAL